MNKKKIAVLVGSLRKDSFNKKIANELLSIAPAELDMQIVPIDRLPLYNEDFEGNPPKEVVEYREAISNADGFLFFTPEYNRSMSGALKNAIDVASRPWGQNLWDQKPGGVITTSISSIGGFGANNNVRQAMIVLNAYLLPQPEGYIGNAHSLFNEKGELINDSIKQLLKDYVVSFVSWVNKF